jgi:hypothetical protein
MVQRSEIKHIYSYRIRMSLNMSKFGYKMCYLFSRSQYVLLRLHSELSTDQTV